MSNYIIRHKTISVISYPWFNLSWIVFLNDGVIKWKHFHCYWPFVRWIHRSPVSYPHKNQWRGDLMLSLIYAWTNGWTNNPEAGDLRCHRAHQDVTVMDFNHARCVLVVRVSWLASRDLGDGPENMGKKLVIAPVDSLKKTDKLIMLNNWKFTKWPG